MNIIDIDIISDIDLDENGSSAATTATITEQMYIEISNDFRNRIRQKNRIIHELQKKLIILFSLIERFMDTDEQAFIEECRMILDKVLVEDIGIQELD